MTIVAFDPGVTTGYAIGRVTEGSAEFHILESGEFPQFERVDELMREARECVYERFINNGPWLETDSLEVIGVIKYIARRYQMILQEQLPGDRVFGFRRFQDLTFKSHAGDALGHLLVYAYKKYGVRHAS